jgi:hypothetical protein
LAVCVRSSVGTRWRELFVGTLAALDDGVMVTDLEHRTLVCNSAFGRVFPVPAEEAIRLDVQQLRERVVPHLAEPELWLENLRWIYSRPDGVQRDLLRLKAAPYVARYTAPIRGAEGDILGRLWCFRTVTHDPDDLTLGHLQLHRKQEIALWRGEDLVLTPMEFSLLWNLARGCGHTVRREDLFEAAWGYSLEHSSNSLEAQVSRLRRKMAPCEGVRIETRRGVGYRLDLP